MSLNSDHTTNACMPTGPFRHAAFTMVGVGAGAAGLMWWVGFSITAELAAGSVYLGAAVTVLVFGARADALRRFNLANQITWLRVAITAMLAGYIIDAPTVALTADAPTAEFWWLISGAACIALALDGLDGYVARRRGECSDFGAQFDMETDAVLILVLSILVWQTGKTGVWVLIIGGMRYVFIAAGYVFPILTSSLPPSMRRKLVCVGQVVGLVLCLLPIIPGDAASFVAAIALAALTLSFTKDVITLTRRTTPVDG
jgi:phosphatidylglycerophosphate synthase